MKRYAKIAVDFAMTVLLLLLMAYELIGAAVYEWLGIAMFVLVIFHHVLNRRWSRNAFRGNYTPMDCCFSGQVKISEAFARGNRNIAPMPDESNTKNTQEGIV